MGGSRSILVGVILSVLVVGLVFWPVLGTPHVADDWAYLHFFRTHPEADGFGSLGLAEGREEDVKNLTDPDSTTYLISFSY